MVSMNIKLLQGISPEILLSDCLINQININNSLVESDNVQSVLYYLLLNYSNRMNIRVIDKLLPTLEASLDKVILNNIRTMT